MTQLAITARDNKNLFSNYYLDNQIKNNPEWKKEEHKAAFSEIKKLYDTEKDFIPTLNEKQLEQRFFGPIFKILNHTVEVNEGTEQGEFPDYAFFPERASLDDAHKKTGNSFYDNAFAIGEVKRWGIELDRFGKDKFERKRNPSQQIWMYLHDVAPKWGILSNGKTWRLYYKDRRRDDYYEIDLPTLLAKDEPKNVEEFRYFYYFFRRDAFLRSADGSIFLYNVLSGSAQYAKVIGDDLKDNVYKAMKKVAEGFFSWSQNGLDIQNEAARETVQKCTMLLLYRFLFLLYAEGKGLLDLKKPQYQSYSFYKLKNEVKEKQDGPLEQRYLGVGTTLWSRLKDTFRLINQGSESFGIDKNVLHVPAYNGGLFDPQKNPELEKWVIGDTYLSEAINLLSRSRADGGKLDFVDYSTLEIRHLGSIYEGLLEYKLRVADDEMIVNGGEWVKLEDFNKDRKQKKVFSDFNEFDRVKKGQIFLATDKGERKATGSYYTPDYIVNYIVKNTIGPVVDEKWKEAEETKKSFVDATLSVKVLDPAMGSGHFLVGSIEFLSEKLLLAVKKDIDNGRFSDESHLTSDWARREVVSHCIYGVDLNLMAVELAKVGLWLTTISKEKPLSFLDHRLKQGNSLIGARLEDLPYYPDINAKKKEKRVKDAAQQTFEVDIEKPFFVKIVNILNSLTDINDDTIENIHKKKDIFEKLMNSPEYQRIKAFANLNTSIYLGVVTTEVNKLPKDGYYKILWALRKDEEGWRKDTNREWFGKARKLAQEKSFFHWELEFPEIFFEGGAPKENPGWDAVVGNPPYVRQEQLGEDKEYFKLNYEVHHGIADLYVYFFERSHKLVKKSGYFGFISSNKFMRANYGISLRNFLLKEVFLKQIIDFGDLPIFPDATTYPCIVITQNELRKGRNTIFVPVKSLDFDLLDNVVKSSETLIAEENFKGHNWSLAGSEERKILDKIRISSNLLDEYTQITPKRGILTGLGEAFVINDTTKDKLIKEDPKSAEIIKPFLMGEDVGRYNINYKGRYLIWTYVGIPIESYPAIFNHLKQFQEKLEKRWDKGKYWWELRSCDYYKDFDTPKIVYLVFQVKPAFYLDNDGFYCNNAVWIIPNDNKFLVSILNSKLGWYLISKSCTQIQNGYQLIWDYFKNIPIRRISFTTPPDRSAALVEQAKALYSDFLGAPASKDLDRINRMDRIDTAANPVNPVRTAPDRDDPAFKCGDFVSARLSAAPEESDVVHDLLAYLAQRMIEMNKTKNAEIKSFLDFLKGEIGVSVEDLSNKTAIQEYYSHEFQNLIDVLAKNKKKLKAGYDPKSPSNYKHLQQWYNDSTGKLKPLMGRIEATDGLIDRIVYKLYGLTDDEIKIVEESISGNKDLNTKEDTK